MRAFIYRAHEFITAQMSNTVVLKNLLQKILVLFSLGAIIVAFSEFWFYQIEENVGNLGIIFFYGILAYVCLIILQKYHIENWEGFFITAVVFGFLIESIYVPVFYTAIPFTIVWTSMAWHALLSFGVGWYLFHKIYSQYKWKTIILFSTVMGVFLGLWNSYMWNVVENEETILYSAISSDLFFEQFLLGYIIFILGHFVFERTYNKQVVFSRFELYFFLILILLVGLFNFVAYLPFSLILMVLLFLCHMGLQRNGKKSLSKEDGNVDFIQKENNRKIPPVRYLFSLVIPLVALLTYDFIVEYGLYFEMNAIVIVICGPLSIYLFVKALMNRYEIT